MKTRVITGVVLVLLISAVIWLGGWWLRGVALLLLLLSMHEMYAAYRFKGLRPVPVGLAFAPLLLFCALVLPGDRVMEAAVSLMALLAAVGGTASSAFYQPAVMAAAGSMTTLISHVTLPFAVSVAVLTMVGSLSDGLRISRLRRLLRQVAEWTLGFGFTVFIGVMTVQGVSAAAVDGVSIRTAKYAMDNFIPIVGGMFADTVDTLVGCSLIVQNAVGVLGLILLLGALAAPLLRTVVTMFLYRAASALLQPIGDSPLARGMGDYAEVFSLLFIIQLSVGAMFLLLVAQLLTVANLTVMLR